MVIDAETVIVSLLSSGVVATIIGVILGKYFEKKHFKFSKLHEKRIEIISEIYSNLYEFEEFTTILVAPIRPHGYDINAIHNDAIMTGNRFVESFRKNRIFFDKNICKILDDLVDKFNETHSLYRPFPTDSKMIKKVDIVDSKKAWDIIDKHIPVIKKRLEGEFNKLLGV